MLPRVGWTPAPEPYYLLLSDLSSPVAASDIERPLLKLQEFGLTSGAKMRSLHVQILSSSLHLDKAEIELDKMISEGIQPTAAALSAVVEAQVKAGELSRAAATARANSTPRSGRDPRTLYNALLSGMQLSP